LAASVTGIERMPEANPIFPEFPAEADDLSLSDAVEVDEAHGEVFQETAKAVNF
jgi:hypothetical protein